MAYPPRYLPSHDFALDEQSERPLSGVAVSTELANLAETTQQIIAFLRAGFTSDKRWQPASAVSQEVVQSAEYTANPGDTEFALPGGLQANPASDFARVYVDGKRLGETEYTLGTDEVTLATPLLGGEVVIVELINDYATLREELASNLVDLGASLIGINDALGKFSSANVEDALAELAVKHGALRDALGNLALYAKIDGSRPWQADQSMGGNRLTDVADGQDPQDVVTVAQLSALAAIFGDLTQVYLQLSGGVMQGIINMNNNFITGVRDATSDTHAVNLRTMQAVLAAQAQNFLPRSGGDMTGQMTVLFPGFPMSPVPLELLEQAVADLEAAIQNLQSQIDTPGSGGGDDSPGIVIPPPRASVELDGVGLGSPIPDFANGGVFHFEDDLTVVASQVSTARLVIHVTGNATISGNISAAFPGADLEIHAGGDIEFSGSLHFGAALDGPYRDGTITLRAGGEIRGVGVGSTIRAGRITLAAGGDISLQGEVHSAGFFHALTSAAFTHSADIHAKAYVVRSPELQGNPATGSSSSSSWGSHHTANGGGGGTGAHGGRGGRGRGSTSSRGGVGPFSIFRGHNAILSRAARQVGGRGGAGSALNITATLDQVESAGGGRIWIFARDGYTATAGATLRADGNIASGVQDFRSEFNGGGGGGNVVVTSYETITGLRARANGGRGGTDSSSWNGGRGGGGSVFAIGQSVPAPDVEVLGGQTGGDAATVEDGVFLALELTATELEGLYAAGVLLP